MTDIDFFDVAYSPVSPYINKQRINNPVSIKKTKYGSRILKQVNNFQVTIIKRKQYKNKYKNKY